MVLFESNSHAVECYLTPPPYARRRSHAFTKALLAGSLKRSGILLREELPQLLVEEVVLHST